MKAIAGGALKWLGWQLAALSGPALLGLLAVWAGHMQASVPLAFAIAAGALTFGGAAAGVYYMLAVLERFAVRGRLGLLGPRIALDLNTKDVSLGVNLQSRSDVAMEFEITEIRTQLNGKYPQSKPFEKIVFEMPPRGQGFFSDWIIGVNRAEVAGTVCHGSIVARIAYGRPGSRKHVLPVRCGVHLRFDSQGELEGTSWETLA